VRAEIRDTALFEKARSAAGALLEKGFMAAGSTDIERAGQFSLKFETAGAGNLSRLFRSLGTDLEKMLSRDAGFDPAETFSTLSRIYLTASLFTACRDDPAKRALLVNKSRSVYRRVPLGTFTGLGAWPWITRSGYAGISCLVFYRERKTILSCTSALPGFYDKTKEAASPENLANRCKQEEYWNPPVSLRQISRSVFTLRNCGISDEGRISSSKETGWTKSGMTDAAAVKDIATLFPPDADEPDYDYFGGRKKDTYCLVHAREIPYIRYDRVNQELDFVLDSGRGNVQALIPYSELHMPALRFIEELAEKGPFGPLWFVCRRNGNACVPLCMIGEEVNNFYFPS
jgi:hypothetical protein